MTRHEFDPADHERQVRALHDERLLRIARVALFDEMIDYHLDGQCTFDEAIAQFLHDAEVGGMGYDVR